MIKFKITTFDNLSEGDKFKFSPYGGEEVPRYMKTGKSMVMDYGVYNAIRIDGPISYKNINPDKYVYEISESSSEEEE